MRDLLEWAYEFLDEAGIPVIKDWKSHLTSKKSQITARNMQRKPADNPTKKNLLRIQKWSKKMKPEGK